MGNRDQGDITPDHGQRSPAQISPRPSSTTRPASSAEHAKDQDATDERVDVSRLIQGLRSAGTPLPMVSNPREEEGCHAHNEAVLEQKNDNDPGVGSQMDPVLIGPAPFYSSA